jgi:predicted Zn finger-like uncharacterized protein
MSEQIHCPSCNAVLRVPENLLGRSVKCPKCKTTFTAEAEELSEPTGIVSEPTPTTRRPTLEPEEPEEETPADDEDEDRPRRRRRGQSYQEAKLAVAGPAIALMVVGGLGILGAILDLLFRLLNLGLANGAPARADASAYNVGYQVGTALGTIFDIFGICWALVVLLGAFKMKKLESFGFAMTACILALLPCSFCCVLGLPFGIWGLVVLNKPEVKDVFS